MSTLSAGAGTDEVLLFTAEFEATAAGTVEFTSNAADAIPSRETLFFGSDDPIPAEEILFGTTSLTIDEAATGPVDLVAFADTLASAGVEFWTTSQFNRDATAQRAVFEDGVARLPIREALTSSGDLNSAATGRRCDECEHVGLPRRFHRHGCVNARRDRVAEWSFPNSRRRSHAVSGSTMSH